jgi:hypothetical protein
LASHGSGQAHIETALGAYTVDISRPRQQTNMSVSGTRAHAVDLLLHGTPTTNHCPTPVSHPRTTTNPRAHPAEAQLLSRSRRHSRRVILRTTQTSIRGGMILGSPDSSSSMPSFLPDRDKIHAARMPTTTHQLGSRETKAATTHCFRCAASSAAGLRPPNACHSTDSHAMHRAALSTIMCWPSCGWL